MSPSRRESPESTKRPEPEDKDAAPTEALSHEAVAHRAYELYLERGCQEGHDVEDWLRAEAEVSKRRG